MEATLVHPRASHLIRSLGLAPHPEGGHFRELYRSASRVQPLDERDERSALTTIYFLLAAGEQSRWHRVASDEVWHFYEGDPLELVWLDAEGGAVHRALLGAASGQTRPVRVVPAGCWQAARPTGAYTLVGCTVGPGFEFADFQMLGDAPAGAEVLRRRHPELADLL